MQVQPVQCPDHIVTPHTMLEFQRRSACLTLLFVASASLVACGSLSGGNTRIANVITPYKMDIVQGNFVSKEQAAAVQPGMSRTQVRDILGTPLLVSVFHADRWDYVFTLRRQGAEPQSRRVTVFFKNDVVDRIEADELPSETEFVSSLKSTPVKGPLPAMTASEQDLEKFPAPAPRESAPSAPAPGAAPTTYPPLEPQ